MTTIDGERLLADLKALAEFGATAEGGVSRASFSPADRAARDWLSKRAHAAGLIYREDAAGNIFIRLEASQPVDHRVVWTGSHLDSVPNGGPLDGALGVITSLEAVRALAESGQPLSRSVEVVSFADEEGAYGGFLGSKAAVMGLDSSTLAEVRGREGDLLVETMAAAGFPPERIAEAWVNSDQVEAFVEVHIEQGIVLEQLGIQVGVVSDIVGVLRGEVVFSGRPDHAGTTPMNMRRDAVRGLASLLDGLEGVPEDVGEPSAVITCGRIEIAPGAENIVPGRAVLHFDVRHRDKDVIMRIEKRLEERAMRAATAHNLEASYRRDSLTDPVPLDEAMQERISRAADTLGVTSHVMPSGAGHDSQVVAPVIPTGMIFVPSVDGRSHSPLEYSRGEDIVAGAEVLFQVLSDMLSVPSHTVDHSTESSEVGR